jgi:amino acid adenylation domain-containing protein
MDVVCAHVLFENQVRRTPNATAIICGGDRLLFRDLNERANRLAHRLRGLGAGPDVPVGVYLERSADLVAALLGVWKAGAAYVPLEPGQPAGRLAFMLADARVPFLVTRAGLRSELPPHECLPIVIDDTRAPLGEELAGNPLSGATAEDLAYILYTSGSTGKPKGVLMPHAGLVNYLTWCLGAYPVADGSGSPVHSPISFDLTVTSLFAPLLAGRTVHLLPGGTDVEQLATALNAHSGYSVVKITPAHLEALGRQIAPDRAAGLTRAFVIGGEALTYAQVAFWQSFASGTVLVNEYGPTEAAVGCCVYPVPAGGRRGGSVPIGRPIANTRLYVLGPDLNPVATGDAGELYVAGAGLARGYHDAPALTAEKFLPDPFVAEPGSRMYRTGDLARILPDGNLEFLGRIDDQVKVRGYRVEPAEVEAALRGHPAVREVVVLAHRGAAGGDRLAAYVVSRPGAGLTVTGMKRFLSPRLPDYMVPASMRVLDAIPLTANGKVDRAALPPPDRADFELADLPAAPREAREAVMVRVWQEVLNVRPVGVRDDFFALGGDSLLALRLLAAVEREFGTRLSPATLVPAGTVEAMVRALDAPAVSDRRPLVPIRPGGTRPPFFCVHAIGGEALSFAPLARHLDQDQPFYGLQARSVGPGEGPASIVTIATDYLDEVRSVQPAGPYFLGGYSFGGTVAFEMAQQLQARGERVALLAVIDQESSAPGGPGRRRGPAAAAGFLGNLPFWVWYDLFRTRPRAMLTRVRVRLRALVPGRRTVDDPGLLFDSDRLPADWLALVGRHYHAWLDYTPRPYPGSVTLIKARARPLFRPWPRDLGWGHLAEGGVDVITVSGAHDNMLTEPYVRSLACRLDERLSAARAGSGAGTTPSAAVVLSARVPLRPREEARPAYPVDPAAATHRAVVNERGQYSIWQADGELPLGWSDTGISGTRADCLAKIEDVWTDLRPRRALRTETARPAGMGWK